MGKLYPVDCLLDLRQQVLTSSIFKQERPSRARNGSLERFAGTPATSLDARLQLPRRQTPLA